MITNIDPPKIIAEISCNHLQDTSVGYRLIDAAKETGADYVKIQYYSPQDMTIASYHLTHIYHGSGTPWDGKNLKDIYNQGFTSPTLAQCLFRYAERKGIPLFSSVFSESGLEFLEKLGCPMYKIASFENNDYELIKKVADTGKPLFVSTGTLKTDKEVFDIKDVAQSNNLVLMHCISAYPTYPEEANVSRISRLRYMTGLPIGFSDHTKSMAAAGAATVLGAVAIEKHLMLESASDTLDEQFSLTESQFGDYVGFIKSMHETLYAKHDPQEPYRQFKRSLYVTQNIKAGELFTHENIKAYRPYLGLDPSFLPRLVGTKATKDLYAGNPLTQADLVGVV